MTTSKPEPKKTKGMCIATRCTSVEQFIQMFHRFVDEESFFVSTLNTRAPGLETSFSVQLVDGTPVLRGLCVVMQAWTDASNPFKTPGVRLGIKRLTANSMVVFEQLLITRSAAKPPPVPGAPKVITPKVITPIKPLASAAPQAVTPTTTKPMAGAKLKAPATIAVGVPKTVAVPKALPKSPFTETAPTKHAASRVELSQPARASSEPIPEPIVAESTDLIEEKTDVREPKMPVVSLGEPMPPAIVAKREESKPVAKLDESKPVVKSPPLPPDMLRQELATALDLAKPVADQNSDEPRTPGSDLVLPANPLMNLSDESLEGYVDCTLYEETGNFFPADDETGDFVDDVVPPPVAATTTPARASGHEPRQRTITPLPATPDIDGFQANPETELAAQRFETSPKSAAYEDKAVVARDSSPSIVVPPAMPAPPMPRDSVILDPSLIARGSTPAFEGELRSIDTPTFSADGSPKRSFDGNALPLPATPRVASRKRLPMWLVGGAVGMIALVVIVIAFAMSGSDDGAKPSATPAKVAELAPPLPTKKPEPATDVTAAADEPEDTNPSDGPPMVGEGPCKVVVASTPAGSIISLDGKSVGPSPLTVGASCAQHKIDIAHARYQATSKVVTLKEGKAESLEVTLQRPTHSVTVTSNPSGATIFIDGRSAGTTPTKLSVLGFVTIKLEIKKTGYQPANTKLYSRYPQDNVAVKLTKW